MVRGKSYSVWKCIPILVVGMLHSKGISMLIRDGYYYHIKDEFFLLVNDSTLMSNKENGGYRPHYLAVKDAENPSIFWMVPVSSKYDKYKNFTLRQEELSQNSFYIIWSCIKKEFGFSFPTSIRSTVLCLKKYHKKKIDLCTLPLTVVPHHGMQQFFVYGHQRHKDTPETALRACTVAEATMPAYPLKAIVIASWSRLLKNTKYFGGSTLLSFLTA